MRWVVFEHRPEGKFAVALVQSAPDARLFARTLGKVAPASWAYTVDELDADSSHYGGRELRRAADVDEQLREGEG